uniref:Uncharacterized protein n=1 Tax=Lepeophtheirus salmonis TaxID=72036 RepID=A0A0K2TEW6_LEPSM
MGSADVLDFRVAKMVLDYLGDKNLHRTRKIFLEECSDLRDASKFLDLRGNIVSSLTDLLEEYLDMRKTLDDIMFKVLEPNEVPIYKTDGTLRKLNVLSDYLRKKKSSPRKIKEPTLKKVHSSQMTTSSSISNCNTNMSKPRVVPPSTPLQSTFLSITSPSPKRLDSPSSVSIRITPVKGNIFSQCSTQTQKVSFTEKPSRKRCLDFSQPPLPSLPPHQIKQFQMGLKVALIPYTRPNNVIVDLSAVPRSNKPRLDGASKTLNILSDVANCLQLGALVNRHDLFPSPSKKNNPCRGNTFN